MKPIPVVFHIGPLQVHTYGIGLAITFWFAYRYLAKRLRDHGYPDAWFGRAFVWIVVASVVGARAAHVIANFGLYSNHLIEIFAVWHGGLSSFGGLALGVPVGLYCARRWCPEIRMIVAADLVAPVLVIAWTVGRLLGPQLMVQGGGRQTTAWYGMAYAGQVGKRVPVPIFQAIECAVIYVIVLWIERIISRRGGPLGVVTTSAVALYGVARYFDEHVLLPHGKGGFAVEVTAVAMVAVGAILVLFLLWRDRGRSHEGVTDPWRSPLAPAGDDHQPGAQTHDVAASPANQPSSSHASVLPGRGGPEGEDG